MAFSFHIGRHRAKDKSVKVVPGSEDDVNLVHLTEAGWQSALEDGRSGEVISSDQDLILVKKSPFVRVTETALARLTGAGYDPTNQKLVQVDTSADLGFSPVSFPEEVMAVYDRPDYLDALFKEHFVSRRVHDGKPSANMAQFMYGSLTAFIDGYNALKKEVKKGNVHLGIETHSDIIDACFAGMVGALIFDADHPGNVFSFKESYHGTSGPIKDSEFITGRFDFGNYDNPNFVLRMGENNVSNRYLTNAVSLDDIKYQRDRVAKLIEK